MGHRPCDQGCGSPATGDRMSAGMRYHSAEVADVDRYIADAGWAMEQKMDGVRCIAAFTRTGTVRLTETTFLSHTGAPLHSGEKHHAAIAEELSAMPVDVTVDGELMADGHYWVYDLLAMSGQDTTGLPFADRRRLLVTLFGVFDSDLVRLVESFTDPAGKTALWQSVLDSGAEGVVVKRLTASYQSKGRTRNVLKIKITKTIDVVVIGYGRETESAVLGLYHDGVLTEVGKCSLIGKPHVEIGDVIEVQYLYVVDPHSPRLYQGRMMRRRDDKTAEECQWDQLDGTAASKEVIAA